MAESCRALGLPIIGGNVSFYNESGGADIDPTPVLGVLGLVDVVRAAPPGMGWSDGDTVVLLGPRWARSGAGGEEEPFPLEGSRWATERRGHRAGTLPGLDLELHGAACAFVAGLVSPVVGGSTEPPVVGAVHDVSSGGLGVALAEMAVAGRTGAHVAVIEAAELFSELPSRFVVSTPMPDELCARAEAAGVAAVTLGRAGGPDFVVDGLVDVPVAALIEAHEGNLAAALGEQ
jgi:phosphoribosylformylglycinamidine synthase subunit PurL